MTLTLHPDWKHILLYAWSMRLNALVAVMSAADAAVSYAADGKIGMSLLVFAVSIATSAARVVKQKKFSDE